mgnify:CR=1 FL=1
MTTIRKPFSRTRVGITFTGTGRTKQNHKDECDINHIMRKFKKTGVVEHRNENEPQYGFADAITFNEAMNIVITAQTMFDDLPSHLRRKFGNDPSNFLDFVQNPENLQEMRELGLAREDGVPAEPGEAITPTSEPVTAQAEQEPVTG